MDEIDIPQYFLCPISLQIMRDPVTTVTGITYDRESIEQWLSTAENSVCPVTKLPMSKSAGLTPNHMLRRLIQAWCIANAKSGIDRIPTPKSPLHRSAVLKLIRAVGSRRSSAENLEALRKLDGLASDVDDENQQCLAEAGAAKSMISYVMRRFDDGNLAGVDLALRILRLVWSPTAENKQIVEEKPDVLFQSILWILNSKLEDSQKTDALILLKNAVEILNSSFLEILKPDFFKEMMRILRLKSTAAAAKRTVLKFLKTFDPSSPATSAPAFSINTASSTTNNTQNQSIEIKNNRGERDRRTGGGRRRGGGGGGGGRRRRRRRRGRR